MSTPPIRKAVFPVAGMGTRFLPATKAFEGDEPAVDKPVINTGWRRRARRESSVHLCDRRGKHVIETISITPMSWNPLSARKRQRS
jgi:UTP-glucose-1-phosphate uridylyltransferase